MRLTINIVKHIKHGFELVEVVEREAVPIRETNKRGCRGMFRGKFRVSYKGKFYRTFHLPECYGDCAGTCIAINHALPIY